MEAAKADLRKRGFTSAALWVLEENKRARRFYETGGWRSDGARKDCFGRTGSAITAPVVRYVIEL